THCVHHPPTSTLLPYTTLFRSQPSAPLPKTDAPKPALRLEAPDAPQPQRGLILPKNSTSRSLQDTIRDAARSPSAGGRSGAVIRSEEHTSELQSRVDLVCRLLL